MTWVERQPLRGGALIVRVRRIEVAPRSWTITAEIANRSATTVRIGRRQPRDFRKCVTSIVRYVRTKRAYGSTINRQDFFPLTFRPALPRMLAPGKIWRGTFGSRGVLPKGQDMFVCYGFFTTAEDPDGFSLISERSFRA
ncbi:MAG: hypothetical protein MSC30_19965 [Gaiellaceae bacterium MAG52_C11]|nr:hypothetical protein [Candidatus Gaiellasilicea maunaloa]